MPGSIQSSAVGVEAIVLWMHDYLRKAHGIDLVQACAMATFGDLGLTSAELLEMIYELSQWLDRDIEETLVFENPTIEELAKALATS